MTTKLMNRDEFTAFREETTKQRPGLLRLDSMDPFTTMDYLKGTFNTAAACTDDQALDIWADRMNVSLHRDNALATHGVRTALGNLFNLYAGQGRELWLPEDVYPFYWQAAAEAGLKPRSFPTLPAPDFSALKQAAPNSIALLTSPVSPLGRSLTKEETAELMSWMEASPERRLILDTVYTYEQGFDKYTEDLYARGQCVITHSLSKAWLERGIFGIVLAPSSDRDAIKSILKPASPEACLSAFTALQNQTSLPDIQQGVFDKQWEELLPAIRIFDPDFTPPESGYFGIVKARYDRILEENNTLVIPASVFGSKNPDLSVVSCLEPIKLKRALQP